MNRLEAKQGRIDVAIADSLDLLAQGEYDAFQTRVTHKAPAPETTRPGPK